ncbi:MAG: hypothetical protein NC406_08400 [Bacteroides sp.]|nr:hypothetical protein [Bacteroides sp.]
MKQDTTPSRQQRPNRWARLKRQLKQARADRDTATHLKEFAQLYIVEVGLWGEFNDWLNTHSDTNPCNPIFEFVGQQARQIENLTENLNTTQAVADMHSKSERFYYELLGKKDKQINTLITMVANLTEKWLAQREEIANLKKQRQHNGNTTRPTDEGNAPTAPSE